MVPLNQREKKFVKVSVFFGLIVPTVKNLSENILGLQNV